MTTAREQIESEAQEPDFWLRMLDEREELRAAWARHAAARQALRLMIYSGQPSKAVEQSVISARDAGRWLEHGIIDAEAEQRELELEEEARDRAAEYAVEQKMEEAESLRVGGDFSAGRQARTPNVPRMQTTEEEMTLILDSEGEVLREVDAPDLREAYLCGADLRGARLAWRSLRRADLRYVDLSGADLRGADLRGADLQEADLRGADLRQANCRGACFRKTNLRDADLREADLHGADLGETDLKGADLRGTHLTNVLFQGAKLYGFNLIDGGQDLRGRRFVGWLHNTLLVINAGGHDYVRVDGLKYEPPWPRTADDNDPALQADHAARITLIRTLAVARGWVQREPSTTPGEKA